MAHIFCVDEHNRQICLQEKLFGVPATERAKSQIMNVRKGDKLFLYVINEHVLYGIYEAASDVFKEKRPERGPWKYRLIDRKNSYYPYRVRIREIEHHDHNVRLAELDMLDVGLNLHTFLRRSVIYISEKQARTVETLLSGKKIVRPKRLNSGALKAVLKTQAPLTKKQEPWLQLKVQDHLDQLEDGLTAVGTYRRSSYASLEVEADILAVDNREEYVLIEVKYKNLDRSIWGQIFHTAAMVERELIKKEDRSMRLFVVCNGFDKKVALAFSWLKKNLDDPGKLRVFQYELSGKDDIKLKEVPAEL